MNLKEYGMKILRNSQGLEKDPENEKLLREKDEIIAQFDTIVTDDELSKCTVRVLGWLQIYFRDRLE